MAESSILTVIKSDQSQYLLPDDTLKITVEIYDLDSEDGSGRNQNGVMFRDRVAVKRRVNCQWGILDRDQMKLILQATDEEFLTLTYPDPYAGESRQIECYVGDRSAPLMLCDPASVGTAGNALGECLWSGLTMNFIER